MAIIVYDQSHDYFESRLLSNKRIILLSESTITLRKSKKIFSIVLESTYHIYNSYFPHNSMGEIAYSIRNIRLL